MRKSRSKILLEKSLAAMLSAIETYNKPDHRYREETFAILALNAWELLLKAKILLDNRNRAVSIHVFEPRSRTDGSASRKLYVRRNRSGNPASIGLPRAAGVLHGRGALPDAARTNIEALMEVRDNAVHYVNRRSALGRHVQELGTASLQNYVTLVHRWFQEDLSRYDFFLMPLAFFRDFRVAETVQLNKEERRLLGFLDAISEPGTGTDRECTVRLAVDIRLRRTTDPEAPEVRITNDPTATAVTLTEEDFRRDYPWDYSDLVSELRHRYTDFKENRSFHAVRMAVLGDPRYSMRRYLDPTRPEGTKRDFYSPNMVQVFDRHYGRRP